MISIHNHLFHLHLAIGLKRTLDNDIALGGSLYTETLKIEVLRGSPVGEDTGDSALVLATLVLRVH